VTTRQRKLTEANGTNGTAAQADHLAGPELRQIALAEIRPSPLNPRKTFDEVELSELAASIAEKGVLEPILVRPYLAGALRKGGYELVCGERRWHASKLAGLSTVPALVRQLTDQQVVECQVIENEQRADVPILEKVAGYEKLVKDFGLSLEDLAARVGKSVSTIRPLLRLSSLPKIALEALEQGLIATSTAQLICRVPGERSRNALAVHVLARDHYEGLDPADFEDNCEEAKRAVKQGRDGLSYRSVKRLIQDHCMVELKKAPFSRKALDLVPGVGSCDDCPKRAGNNPEEFPNSRADVCTDPDCYHTKRQAHNQLLAEKARSEGRTVITGAAAEKIVNPYGRPMNHREYLDPDTICYDDDRSRTYRDLIGKKMRAPALVETRGGDLKELYPAAAAAAALDEAGISRGRDAGRSNDGYAKEMAKRRQKAKVAKRAALAALGQVHSAVYRSVSSAAGWEERAFPALKAAAKALADTVWEDARRLVATRHGLTGDARMGNSTRLIEGVINEAPSVADLLALMSELAMARKACAWGNTYGADGDDAALWRPFGVNKAALLKQAAAEPDI